jgi:hypothetical protein
LRSVFGKGRKPKILRTDKGSELKNKWVKAFFKKEGVHSIYTENETKGNFAERSIQRLENILHRIFVQKNSYRFVDELANITQSIKCHTIQTAWKHGSSKCDQGVTRRS